MKPFNLKEAKEGKPVVTRDGRKVVELHIFDSPDPYSVMGVLEGSPFVNTWTTEGKSLRFGATENNDFDLFMVGETKTGFFNMYTTSAGGPVIGSPSYVYSTLEKAKLAAECSRHGLVATGIPVVWEE